MKFRLIYEGPLKSNGGIKEKQEIRRQIHSQLSILWKQRPLNFKKDITFIKTVGKFNFRPLVCDYLKTISELDIIFLRPEEPGSLYSQSGDLDNRIKTLLDGLRIPNENQIPEGDYPRDGEDQFFCLLEDDKLITHLSITTDRLLKQEDPSHVLLIINVNVRVIEPTWNTLIIGS